MSALNPFAIVGSILQLLVPKIVLNAVEPWLDKLRGLLQGETLRAIGYGAGVVVYLVAKASGKIPDVPLDQAVIQTGGAAAVLISVLESIRKFVYSPATVAAIVATPPTAAGPINAAAAAGVPVEVLGQAIVDAEPDDSLTGGA